MKTYELESVDLDLFKQFDYYAISHYNLPIELMMENAGFHLASLIAQKAKPHDLIQIGIGNGNNGGGGLVAARRLKAWGYYVTLDIPEPITRDLPLTQLARAKLFGIPTNFYPNPDIWVDAYLGFNQRLPITGSFEKCIINANACNAYRISLDIPTGYMGYEKSVFFNPDCILTLAAPKKILDRFSEDTEIYVADLGIPKEVYEIYGIVIPPFYESSLLKLRRLKRD